ncbi:prenyltransferase/squalene oxidase repeat-containing protein [Pseudomaricurvus sp. HS19]|uniref:prenyltransferase/squalene oxidase repeat-containing protein n=1 Tax=Pseudomaricurvus sp. HS19 TaxID=2692626 RepID=UPI001F1E6FA3|nr:prenyltransferase/squalene oxidase repeat-containing protein [Pseudomaricurvus sp. HS19]
MDSLLLSRGIYPAAYLQQTVDYILSVQREDGCIPWFEGGKADPWDHVEAAMGLSIAGEHEAAERAYHWLAAQQLEDGSWYANYLDNQPLYCDKRETNFVAYVATGVWHHYLVTGDLSFLQRLYPCVERAIDFVLRYQSPTGEIYWAVGEDGEPLRDALVTGCSSVLKSLECAVNIAATLQREHSLWRAAYHQLFNTLRFHPECFDRTWESKARYSMDWFYPVLAGVYAGAEARQRLHERWDQFVRKDMGCVCVSDEPWVTVAESCELTMALLAAGEHGKAIHLYGWLHQWRDGSDGAYWTGYQYREQVLWPEEKPTWTAAAVILAADAITEHTGAARLFLQSQLLPEKAGEVTAGEEGRVRTHGAAAKA